MKVLYCNEDDMILTEITASPINKSVFFINYTDEPIDCAFGVKKEVDYQDFLAFLESRTISSKREDITDILRDLKMKQYDPIELCRKFKGRVAHDHHYLIIKNEIL